MEKILSFTDQFVGKVEARRRGKTLYFGGAIATLSHEVRISNINRSFDRSCETTARGSNRFSR